VPGEAARFVALYVVSYALSLSLLGLLVRLSAPVAGSKLAADAACFALNFVVMRAWVFRDRA
jgi:putative flippase GtrA